MFDRCANGPVLKCLPAVEEWPREVPAIDVAGRLRSARAIELLTRLVSLHGAPRYLRSNNRPAFVSSAMVPWLCASGIDAAFIDPGTPWQYGTHESFNGTFRSERLNLELVSHAHGDHCRDRAVAPARHRREPATERPGACGMPTPRTERSAVVSEDVPSTARTA